MHENNSYWYCYLFHYYNSQPPAPLTITSGCPVVITLTPGLSPSSLILRPGNEATLLKMGCSETPLGHYALLVIKSTFDLFFFC